MGSIGGNIGPEIRLGMIVSFRIIVGVIMRGRRIGEICSAISWKCSITPNSSKLNAT